MRVFPLHTTRFFFPNDKWEWGLNLEDHRRAVVPGKYILDGH
jgi:hypothetical protein